MFNGNLKKIEDFLIANILKNPKWYPPINDEHIIIYKEWLRRVESLSYLFEGDNKHLRKRCIAEYEKSNEVYDRAGRVRSRVESSETHGLSDSIVSSNETMSANSENCSQSSVELNSVYFNLCVLSNAGTHPLIVREALGGRIAIETLTLFCHLSGCHESWDRNDPSIVAGVSRVLSYESLLSYDLHKYLAIMRSVWHPK